PIPFKPSRGSVHALEKVQSQARIQLAGRRANLPIHELLLPVEEGRGLALLPEAAIGDIFLDLEGDHFAAEGGREYLFGMTVVGQGLRASVESYSIKELECFYEFKRKSPLREAGNARRAIEIALENGDTGAITPEIHDLVTNYNEEDCISTLRLRAWLESLRE